MTSKDKDFIRRILSQAECGSPEFEFGAVYVYNDDNRFDPPRKQVTLSVGFTEGGGNLKTVLAKYVEAKGLLASEIEPFLAGLGDKSRDSLCNNATFKSLLKQAGTDPIMHRVQNEEFDAMYLDRAIAWGEKYGFTLPLSFLVIADSYLHSGSMLSFLINRFPEKKPCDGGDEQAWINAYLRVRHDWLNTHSNKVLRNTTYRAECYMEQASKDNWFLSSDSIVMHGDTVTRTA